MGILKVIVVIIALFSWGMAAYTFFSDEEPVLGCACVAMALLSSAIGVAVIDYLF